MSEENEVDYTDYTQQSSMDAMLDAIQSKNLSQSRHHFDNLMQAKISDALEAEKINIASQIYNHQPEEEQAEMELDYDEYVDTQDDEVESGEEYDVEGELEDAFDESEEEYEDEVEV